MTKSPDFEIPLDQRVMLLSGCKPVMGIHHPAKFGDHMHCGSGNIMFLVIDFLFKILYALA